MLLQARRVPQRYAAVAIYRAVWSHHRATAAAWPRGLAFSNCRCSSSTGNGGGEQPVAAYGSSETTPDRDFSQARAEVGAARRVVVKMGTAVVTHEGGVEIALGRVTSIVEQLAQWQRRGLSPVLVSSGSIGLGATDLGFEERPRSLGLRQACAAVGQGHLIGFYAQAFAQLGIKVAQVLLTNEDLATRDRALCLRTTLLRLMELGVIPILNENDSVSVRELLEVDSNGCDATPTVFGDNDGLSARVATAIDADLLVLLTDVDGVYNRNPGVDPSASRISQLDVSQLVEIDTAGAGSVGGTGGMRSKVDAAVWAGTHGVTTLIANGIKHSTLRRIMSGEDVGTIVLPPPAQRQSRKLASRVLASRCKGALVINTGASAALSKKSDSLLPDGIISVEGSFEPGDVVELRDAVGLVLGRGLVNYASSDCAQLAGLPASQIAATLGWRGYDAIIGREHMLLADRLEDELEE